MSAPEPCTWLRREGLLAEEQGQSIEAHLAGCAACRAQHAEINQLRTALAQLPATGVQPAWQRAVWARIETRRRARWWRVGLQFGLPVAAAAMLAIVVPRVLAPTPLPEGGLLLAYHFEPDSTRPRTRGDFAVGDTVVLEATGAEGRVIELRVYRDDAGLVYRCGDGTPCQRQGARVVGRFTIPAIGQYRALVLTADRPLPAPAGSLDDDLAALGREPGVTHRQADAFQIW